MKRTSKVVFIDDKKLQDAILAFQRDGGDDGFARAARRLLRKSLTDLGYLEKEGVAP